MKINSDVCRCGVRILFLIVHFPFQDMMIIFCTFLWDIFMAFLKITGGVFKGSRKNPFS